MLLLLWCTYGRNTCQITDYCQTSHVILVEIDFWGIGFDFSFLLCHLLCFGFCVSKTERAKTKRETKEKRTKGRQGRDLEREQSQKMAKLKHLFSGRGRSTTSSESNTSSTGGNSVTIRPPPRSGSLKKRLSRLRRQQQELPSNEGDKQQQSSSSTEFFDPFGLDSDGFIDSTKNNNEERKNQSVDQSFDSFMDGDHNDMTFDLDDNENDFFLFSTTTNPDEWVTAKQVGPNRTKSGLLSSPSNQQRQKNNKSSGTGSGTVKESSHTATTVETSFDSGYPSMFSFITRRSQKSESPRRQQKQPKQTASATANSNKSPKEQKKQTIDILPTQDQEDSVYIFTDKYSSYDDDSHPAIGGGDVSTIGLSMKSDYSSLDSSSFWRNADNHSFHFQEHTIRVGLYERLSILFDGVTTDPTCRVVGFIYVSDDLFIFEFD